MVNYNVIELSNHEIIIEYQYSTHEIRVILRIRVLHEGKRHNPCRSTVFEDIKIYMHTE